MNHRRKEKRRGRAGIVAEHLEQRQLLSGLVVTYGNNNGISTLSYNNQTLINVPQNGSGDGFRVENYYTLNADGQTYTMHSSGDGFLSSTWTGSNETLQYNYTWGSIALQYSQPSGTELDFNFTVTNNANSGETLGGVDVDIASIHFPNAIPASAPGAWYPVMLTGTDGPGIIPANYQSGSMAFVNDSTPTRPLYISLFTLDNTTGENFYLNTDTAPKSNIPGGIPLYYQNTAPGQTDSFQESIRFGPAGTDPYTLAPDVIQNYANAFPQTLNWPDRRPIASLHLTGPTTPDYSNNPEGWLNDSSSINVTTQAGLDNFGQQILEYALNSLPNLEAENAQGMIVWDIEGQEWAQPTTYIGDASLAFNTIIQNAVNVTYSNGTSDVVTPMGYDYTGQYSLRDANGNPEPLINQFFQIFTNAGYRVGVTIRPTQITFGTNGVPVQTTANEVTELEQKISYAYTTFGCTLFYLDSNSGYDRDELAQVQAMFPNVLIIPEHQTTALYAYAAPYGQLLTYNYVGTPELARLTYPNAFSNIYIPDGDNGNPSIPDYIQQIEANVALGDSVMYRGWYADPYNTTVGTIYDAVESNPSTPTHVVAAPGNNSVGLTWNVVTGAGMFEAGTYNVLRAVAINGHYALVGSGVQGNSFTDATAKNGSTYYYEVAAVNGAGSSTNTAAVSAKPQAGPTLVDPAAATATSDAAIWNLSALGSEAGQTSNLNYTWSVVSSPSGSPAPTFSVNGSNAAQNTVATFHQAGTYMLMVTISDPQNLSITSSTNVAVSLAVANSAAAAPNPVSGKTATLSVLGSDVAGESTLTYNWTSTSVPSNAPPPILSTNGTNAAKNVTATFHQAGTYDFTVTITDAQNNTTTSTLVVVVAQTVTSLVVQPAKSTATIGTPLQFTAIADDQFHNPITSPVVSWSTTGGGTINNSTGLFNPTTQGGFTITAVSGTLTATTTVTVIAASQPTVVVATPPAVTVGAGGSANPTPSLPANVLNPTPSTTVTTPTTPLKKKESAKDKFIEELEELLSRLRHR